MTEFRFCPLCGGPLQAGRGDGGRYCPVDDRTWYRNPAPTVGAVIVRDGRVLVTTRARPPEEGRIDVPGGFVGLDETPVEALKREVEEELGVEIDVSDADYLQGCPHAYGDSGDVNLALGFAARIVAGEPRPADDVAGFEWVKEEDLAGVDFAWEHDRELVRKALRREKF